MLDTKINRSFLFWFTNANFFFQKSFACARYRFFYSSIYILIYLFLYLYSYIVPTICGNAYLQNVETLSYVLRKRFLRFVGTRNRILWKRFFGFTFCQNVETPPTKNADHSASVPEKENQSTSLNFGKDQKKTATVRRPFNNCFNSTNPNYLTFFLCEWQK